MYKVKEVNKQFRNRKSEHTRETAAAFDGGLPFPASYGGIKNARLLLSNG